MFASSLTLKHGVRASVCLPSAIQSNTTAATARTQTCMNQYIGIRRVQLKTKSTTEDLSPLERENRDLIRLPNAKPFEFKFPLNRTCLLMIDFQRDFLEEGGFGHSIVGDNVLGLRKAIEPAKKMLECAREYGMTVVHTLEAHKPDLSDCTDSKRNRMVYVPDDYKRIGDDGPMGRILIRGEYGNDIIDELAPLEDEYELYKPGKGAFYSTDLNNYLRKNNISHILFAGVTTDVCVQTSMREANDRGYNCLLLEDATESFYPEYGFKEAVLKMVIMQDCVVGWTAKVDEVVDSIVKQFPQLAKE